MRLLLLLLLFSPVCFGQTAQQPAEVPVENEPHHHLVFENEYVRVFKVEVAPHEATLVHRHKRDYVVVTIGDAEVTNAVVGKEPKKWSFKDGDVTFLEASDEKSFAHKAVNEGDRFFDNYTVELKKPFLQYYERDSRGEERKTRYFVGYMITEGLFRPTYGEFISGPSGATGYGDYLGICGDSGTNGALVVALDPIQFGSFETSAKTMKMNEKAKMMEEGDLWWVKPGLRFCNTGKSRRGGRAVIIQKAK